MSTKAERRQRRETSPGSTEVEAGTVWLVLEWGCSGSTDEDNCCDGRSGFYAACATEQLARQVLDAQGGHSFGTVCKQRVATTMREAGWL